MLPCGPGFHCAARCKQISKLFYTGLFPYGPLRYRERAVFFDQIDNLLEPVCSHAVPAAI
jgi:hypothetical protein